MSIKQIIADLSIVEESIRNGDLEDALSMLSEIREDLDIIDLVNG